MHRSCTHVEILYAGLHLLNFDWGGHHFVGNGGMGQCRVN